MKQKHLIVLFYLCLYSLKCQVFTDIKFDIGFGRNSDAYASYGVDFKIPFLKPELMFITGIYTTNYNISAFPVYNSSEQNKFVESMTSDTIFKKSKDNKPMYITSYFSVPVGIGYYLTRKIRISYTCDFHYLYRAKFNGFDKDYDSKLVIENGKESFRKLVLGQNLSIVVDVNNVGEIGLFINKPTSIFKNIPYENQFMNDLYVYAQKSYFLGFKINVAIGKLIKRKKIL